MRNSRVTIARARFGKWITGDQADVVCAYIEEICRFLATFALIVLFVGLLFLILVATGVTSNF